MSHVAEMPGCVRENCTFWREAGKDLDAAITAWGADSVEPQIIEAANEGAESLTRACETRAKELVEAGQRVPDEFLIRCGATAQRGEVS